MNVSIVNTHIYFTTPQYNINDLHVYYMTI